jgi:hypothetical protein
MTDGLRISGSEEIYEGRLGPADPSDREPSEEYKRW